MDTTTDLWGNAVTGAGPSTVRGLKAATLKLHAYQADPIADVDAVIAEAPGCAMAHAFRAGVLATALDKAFEPEMLRSLEAAEALAPRANDRERGHIAAARLWADGDLAGAVEAWGRVAIENPRDGLAIQFAHIGDFAIGYSHMLRDRVARALPHWRGAAGEGSSSACTPSGWRRAATTRRPRRRAGRRWRSTGRTAGPRTPSPTSWR